MSDDGQAHRDEALERLLSGTPDPANWFAEFIEQRTTAAAAHVAGCHDDRCAFCYGPTGDPDVDTVIGDDEQDRDTADEQENDEQMAREMWSPGE